MKVLGKARPGLWLEEVRIPEIGTNGLYGRVAMKYHAVCKRCVVQRSPWCAVLFTTLAIPLILNGSLPVRVFAASPRAPANRVSPGINATPWDEDSDDPTLINMGPIGARAKTDHLLKGLPESHSSFGVIKYIFKGSPAEDKLQLGDVVVGVNDEPFNRDFSRRLGAAIDWREGNTGTLKLNIRRQEKPLALMFAVPKIGSFSATFPYDCDKSDAVLEAALDWLAERQWPNGKLEGDSRSGYSVCTAVAGLAFLGSGKAKYTGNIDLIVEYFLDHFANRRTPDGHFGPTSLEGWQLMYGAMFLSEYYLATCNQRIPPMLVYLNQEIDRLQFRHLDAETVAFLNKQHPKNGVPPYWFGHAKISQGHKGTYFHLGVNTANALVAWGLINECGVAIDRGNIARTMDYVQVACPSGEMGYAGRPDQRGGADDSFGRTGVLAMAYHFNDDRPAFGQKINAALQRHCREHYFTSHSSAVMGKAWGTLGIAASNPVLFRQVMDHFKYDYDLIRLHDGRFVANPAHWHRLQGAAFAGGHIRRSGIRQHHPA